MVDPIIGVITPFKGERTLKRPATEITNMDIDTTTKKPKISIQGKEIVDLDNDDEESINQIKEFKLHRNLLRVKEHHIQHLILILRIPFLKWLILDRAHNLSLMSNNLSLTQKIHHMNQRRT